MSTVATTGGAATTVASLEFFPTSIAVDGSGIYWINQGDGTVMHVPLAGGRPVALARGQINVFLIAIDATAVYWTSDVAIWRVAK